MILKDSKRPNGTTKTANREGRASTKPAKAPRATKKKPNPTSTQHPPPEGNSDNVIDPQLSQSVATPVRHVASPLPSPSLSSPGLDLASIHHNHMPPMGTFRTPQSDLAASVEWEQQHSLTTSVPVPTTEGREDGSDTESDEGSFTRAPSTGHIYPEPPTTEALGSLTVHHSKTTTTHPCSKGRPRPRRSWDEEDSEREEDRIPHTPELKGVYYPGMSLFDSASPEAQRKRNQRKNDSIIAQIERESREVECNEYIYWPDGSLKMCRFITGDVQSSPFKEDTPPPPPPKRGRGRKPKALNATVSKRKPRTAIKSQAPQPVQANPLKRETAMVDLLDLPEGVSHPWSYGHSLTGTKTHEDEDEWLLNMGEPNLRRHQPAQDRLIAGSPATYSFADSLTTHLNPLTTVFEQQDGQYTGQASGNGAANGEDIHPSPRSGTVSNRLLLRESHSRAQIQLMPTTESYQPVYSIARRDKENLPPHEQYAERKASTMSHGLPEPLQRYYTIRGNQSPQTSTTLPAEMAFAGMATPPVYRMSLNPLNPNAHLRRSLPYSSNYTPLHQPQITSKPIYAGGTVSARQKSGINEPW